MNSVPTLRHFLSQTLEQAKLLNGTRELVFLERNTPVAKSFDIIAEEKVLSAPVWDSEQKKWSTIVDIQDYLQYVLSRFGSQKSTEDAGSAVYHIANLSKRDPLIVIPPTATVIAVLKMFDHHLHRILVANSIHSAENTFIVAQSDIISWLSLNKASLGGDVNKTLQEFGMVKEPFTINKHETAFDAFKFLSDHHLYGMAIVDDNQKICGNISVTDLKYAYHNLGKLSLPLEQFFPSQKPLTCTPQTRLIDVIDKFASQEVHRFHIVDSASVPVGVVSMTDIMDAILVLSGEHEGLID